jgi:hypothetical protein
MKLKIILLLVFTLFSIANLFSQSDSIEVYLIDAYSTTVIPYTFKLSFYTSDTCKTKVILEDKYEFEVSSDFTDFHKTEIDLTDLDFDGKVVDFVIISETGSGEVYRSEKFDFDLPFEPQIKSGSDLFTLCLFGSAIFLLPYPSYVSDGHSSYFSLTKEIPVISFRSRSLNYPSGYLSLEYSYIFDAQERNFLRAGYKRIVELPHIEYVSPGITLYTNFKTNQGISPEISVGLFTIKDTFTFYGRYRYNITLHSAGKNFSEIYIGLYSGFFSLYLD